MDFGDSWEVFQDTSGKDAQGQEVAPFELYTVAPTQAPIRTEGSGHPGLLNTPVYRFTDAPLPDIVLIGAQQGGPGLSEWLKKVHAPGHVIVSVCTGAFKVAGAGLLDGKEATTHHWYFGNFQKAFPKVKLVKEVSYVQADPITFSAGGLSSGVDLALHLVAESFGDQVAQNTADYMEYQGTGWKTNHGISVLTTPVTHEFWSGRLPQGQMVVLEETLQDSRPVFTMDLPAEPATGFRTALEQKGNQVALRVAIPGHLATFAGEMQPGGNAIEGVFSRNGRSLPLILRKQPVGR